MKEYLLYAAPVAGLLALAYASLSPSVGSQIRPLMPALKSNWLSAHVMTCFVGYAAFALSFALSLLFLFRPDAARSEETSFDIDEASHQMILLGFLFLSIGIITGAVWANSAWGRYWGWDPKETWALISIIAYAAVLHLRLVPGLRGAYTFNLSSVVAFGTIIMTSFGVNYYLAGLHSYAKGDPLPIPTFVYWLTGIIFLTALFAFFNRKEIGRPCCHISCATL